MNELTYTDEWTIYLKDLDNMWFFALLRSNNVGKFPGNYVILN